LLNEFFFSSVVEVLSVWNSTELRTSTNPLISCRDASNEDSVCDGISGY